MKLKHVELLPRIIANFLNEININCYRAKAMGQRLIKNHLYFHLQDYVKLWGTPAGWDSSPCEGHHKTEIKAPSKSTQCNKSTFIAQTAGRQIEYRLIDRAVGEYSLDSATVVKRERKSMSGSKFHIYDTGMKWERGWKPYFPIDVLQFCRRQVLPILSDSSQVYGCTEHKRANENGEYTFRASPSYRADSGQRNGVWYDWCTVVCLEDDVEKEIPCQLMCFLKIEGVTLRQDGTPHSINMYDIENDGIYAIVRKFKHAPIAHPVSKIITQGSLDNVLYLFLVESIEQSLAVVKDIGSLNNYFVVGNRSQWLEEFITTAESLDTEESLYLKENMYQRHYPEPYNTTKNVIVETSDDDALDTDVDNTIITDDEFTV